MIKYYSAPNMLGGISEYAEFNGVKYYKMKRQGYYKRTNRPYSLLHVDLWIFHGLSIPEGYEIHHKDHNKQNNTIENLEILSKSEHARRHQKEAKPKKAICEICKSIFISNATHNNARFCRECYAEHERRRKARWSMENSEKLNARSLNNYHSGIYNEERTCAQCGNYFSVIKSSPQKFCSRSCASSHSNKIKQGPRYNNSKAVFDCPICGTEYITYKTGKNHRKTCSWECSYKFRFKS